MKKRYLLYLLVCTTVLSGCASRSDFTAISSKNVNLSNIKIDHSKTKGKTTGEDCQRMIIFIPTSGSPTLDEALDKALEAKQSNLLLDAVVSWHSFSIPLIYGETCWSVEGDAYDTYK
jgi:hypothetical protein